MMMIMNTCGFFFKIIFIDPAVFIFYSNEHLLNALAVINVALLVII